MEYLYVKLLTDLALVSSKEIKRENKIVDKLEVQCALHPSI